MSDGEAADAGAPGAGGQLAGKVAIVTGGATGIGAAITEAFAAAGATVVIAARDNGRGEARSTELGCSFIRADLTSPADREALVAEVKRRFGRIDVLVNNAATTGHMAPFLEVTEGDLDAHLDVNLKGTFLLTQAVARVMAGQASGSIINVSTNISMMAEPSTTAYVASKGGINSLTLALAAELGPLGIRVNAVAPGEIQVDRDPDVYTAGAGRERISRVPLRRPGRPRDVALVAVFLASDAAAYVSGTIIPVDGAQLAT